MGMNENKLEAAIEKFADAGYSVASWKENGLTKLFIQVGFEIATGTENGLKEADEISQLRDSEWNLNRCFNGDEHGFENGNEFCWMEYTADFEI